jgi:hypothetical protein
MPNQEPRRVTTVEACSIMGLDRQRLNEDIACGIYACAPAAHKITGRWWDEADLCGLRVYGFFLNAYGVVDQNAEKARNHKPAINKRLAAMYACQVVKALRSDLRDNATRIDFPINGLNDDWTDRLKDEPPAFIAGNAGSNIATICFSLEGILADIRAVLKRQSGEKEN